VRNAACHPLRVLRVFLSQQGKCANGLEDVEFQAVGGRGIMCRWTDDYRMSTFNRFRGGHLIKMTGEYVRQLHIRADGNESIGVRGQMGQRERLPLLIATARSPASLAALRERI